jgi:hypothetical protein
MLIPRSMVCHSAALEFFFPFFLPRDLSGSSRAVASGLAEKKRELWPFVTAVLGLVQKDWPKRRRAQSIARTEPVERVTVVLRVLMGICY